VEDEADFNVPIAKYYKLIKRSNNDFDIIQIAKANPLPPIPKFVFDKKNADNRPVIAPEEVPLSQPEHEEKSHEMKEIEVQAKPDVENKMPINMYEEPKKTGCSCLLL